jgi:hypothetical protein
LVRGATLLFALARASPRGPAPNSTGHVA